MATTKKRHAQSQPGPIQKKQKPDKSKGKEKEKVDPIVGNKKRSRPITASATIQDEDDSDDWEDEEDDVGLEELEDGDEFELEVDGAEADEMDVDQPISNPNAPPKDPNGTSLLPNNSLWSYDIMQPPENLTNSKKPSTKPAVPSNLTHPSSLP